MMSAIVLLFVLSGFFRGFDMKLIESFHLGVPVAGKRPQPHERQIRCTPWMRN